ncbi:hypothetical protein EKK58_10905 [Candidatus Dependentiae bacterium]|nr:MAG: hypothetical protein EKK58_10905 [Candidatus Dependentiae bacterium]
MFVNNSVLLLVILSASFYTFSGENIPYLDYQQRPQEVIEAINYVFNNIADNAYSKWYKNGDKQYNLANIEDKALVEKIILATPEKKDFYFLDVGAGNFHSSDSWGQFCATLIYKLKQSKRIAQDVHVHIINVRGEQNEKADDHVLTWKKDDSCTLYNIGSFKIENLSSELDKYDLTKPFDLIVSRWTLRHLVDPLGTFVQIYNRLNPDGGLYLGDGFFIDYNDVNCEYVANENISSLLHNSKAPFLIHPYQEMRSMNQFIIQRINSCPLQLPLQYKSIRSIGGNYQCNAQKIVNFKQMPEWQDEPNMIEYNYGYYDNYYKKSIYYGTVLSQTLFNWFLKNKLIFQRLLKNNI